MAPKDKAAQKDAKAAQGVDSIRKHGRFLIEDCNPNLAKSTISKIESGLFDSLDQFNIITYSILIVKVIESLKLPSVRAGLKAGTWKPEELANLDRDVLNPDKWQIIQDARLPKNINKERKKGIYKCGRCKSWFTTHIQAQTRSADEGMTTFVDCLDCKSRFKMS